VTVPDDVSKSRRAYQWIRGRIASGEFSPGYRLVLGTLAADLAVSTVPVREALRRLEAEGLVTFERNIGARVRTVDDSEYRVALQTVCLLESAAIALAAPHLAAEDLRRARALNQVMAEGLPELDAAAFSALNQKLHRILYAACPNPRLRELLDTEEARLGRLFETVFADVPGRPEASIREHDALIDLLEAGAAPREIEDAVRRHRGGALGAGLTAEPDPADPHAVPDLWSLPVPHLP
jgi:DNA-binding GntR family transcriptional regulator